MVERHFHEISVAPESYNVSRQYRGVDVPIPWQIWENAYFYRVHEIVDNPEAGARLFEEGCREGDSEKRDCLKVCGDLNLFYSTPENLWNCVTLATVSMMVDEGNDTLATVNGSDLNAKYNFGTMAEFNFMSPFRYFRECIYASCSDRRFGVCATSLDYWRCNAVSPDNIMSFGNVLDNDYCNTTRAAIDSDIAGPGIIIGYLIQYILVWTLCLGFKITSAWIRNVTWAALSLLRRSISDASKKAAVWQDWVSKSRIANAVSSTIVDLQEAQATFSATIAVATIAAFYSDAGLGLANILSLFTWIYDYDLLKGLVTAGLYPLLLAQLVLHRGGKRWWYTMLFVVANWIFMIVITQQAKVDPNWVEGLLRDNASLTECGGNPGPASYCQKYSNDEYHFFVTTLKVQPAAHVLAAFLILDWSFHLLQEFKHDKPAMLAKVMNFAENIRQKPWYTWAVGAVWTAIEALSLALTIIGAVDLWSLLMILHAGSEGFSWSFGQLVAVAIWVPVLFKFLLLNIVGIERGTENRLDDHFEVQRRKLEGQKEVESQETQHHQASVRSSSFGLEEESNVELATYRQRLASTM